MLDCVQQVQQQPNYPNRARRVPQSQPGGVLLLSDSRPEREAPRKTEQERIADLKNLLMSTTDKTQTWWSGGG